MKKNVLLLNDNPIRADDSAQASTIALRDASGDLYANLGNFGGLVNSGKTELKVKTVTADTTLDETATLWLANATSAAIALTLPSPASATNRLYAVVKTDSSANAVTLTPAASETINGASSKALSSQWDKVWIFTDGTNWYLL